MRPVEVSIVDYGTATAVTDVKSDTAAILVDTAEIGTAGAGLTALSVNVNTINSTPIVGNGSTTPFGV